MCVKRNNNNTDLLTMTFLNVYFRLLLTRESGDCFRLIMDVVRQVIKAAQENMEAERAREKGM